MKEYEVSFLREVVNKAGRRHMSKVDTFIVMGSRSFRQAVNRATKAFEIAHNVDHWSRIANDRQVKPVRLEHPG